MKTALLIIDVQKDYFPGGKMELHDSLHASNNLKDLLKHFRNRSMPVIHIRHISVRPGAVFLVPDTPGVEFHESVKPEEGETIIVKNFPNSFRNTELNAHLKNCGITRLVIAGMMTHMCVDTTVRAAFDLGYECIVAADCCATRALRFHDKEISAENVQNSFLAALQGVFSTVLDTNAVIDMLK